MLDIKESLYVEVEIQNFKERLCMGGFVPNQEQLQKRKLEKFLEKGEKFEAEIKKHRLSSTAAKMIKKRTNKENTGIKILKRTISWIPRFSCHRARKLYKTSEKV